MFYEIEKPTVILSSAYHKHYGVIDNIDINSFNSNFNMNSAQELSFDVYKYFNEHPCALWNKLIGLRYIYIPSHKEYYKIDVALDQDDKTVKHITATSAGEYELSNRKIRSLEINTQFDIEYETVEQITIVDGKEVISYVEVEKDVDNSGCTILYNPDDLDKSLLHRALKDRAPDWSIAHVDETIAKKQREFSVSDQTIYDFFTNTVANELDCLFKFDSVNRTISVYDLLNYCEECGYRGEFTDKCPNKILDETTGQYRECGCTNIRRGYGRDTGIYISAANYASKISVNGDEGSVKNCFKVTGGDDQMNANVINANPAGSNLIYRFSDADYDDMPSGLVQKLKDYYAQYDEIEKSYQDVAKKYYNALTSYYFYKTSMMPRNNAKHWEPNHSYSIGDSVYVITLPSYCRLECKEIRGDGKSGAEEFD